MKRLILIDGHAILYRAFHALPITLTTPDNKPVNAVYGFIKMLLKVVQDLKPTHLAVAFDRPKPTFRKKLFKDYQAKRPKAPDDLIAQIDLVHQVVEVMGIPIYEKDGYEADDVIGTLAKQAMSKWEVGSGKWEKNIALQKLQEIKKSTSKKSHLSHRTSKPEVVIVTGDKDILQLVDENTKLYMPVKGLSLSKLYGEKEVKEKFGIESKQMVDYKALIGDPSDNYAGVRGVGPKTAAKLLKEFGTLDNIYQALGVKLDEKLATLRSLNKTENAEGLVIKKSVREKLLANVKSARLSRELAQIVIDVPVKLDLKKARLESLDRPEVRKLFEKLAFRSLIPKLSNEKPESKVEVQKKNEQLTLV